MNAMKLEILKIEEQIRLLTSKGAEVRTVPPDLGLKTSTRRKGRVPGRRKWKELTLCGQNEVVRSQKNAMNRMFLSGKLKRGTVPENTATVPQLPMDCMQVETSTKACEGGAVPPSPAGGTPTSPTLTRQHLKTETVPPNPATSLQKSMDYARKIASIKACEVGAVPPSPAGGTPTSPTVTKKRFKSETVPQNPVKVQATTLDWRQKAEVIKVSEGGAVPPLPPGGTTTPTPTRMQLLGGTEGQTSRTGKDLLKKDSRVLSGGKGVDSGRSELAKSESKDQRNPFLLKNA